MAQTPTVKVLDTGKVFLSKLLIESQVSKVGQARIGSTAGTLPTTDAVSPTPNTVATIAAVDIDVNITNQNEARFTVNFIETIGGFDIGNIMLDLEFNGQMVPFAWFILDDAIPKTAATSDDVGNRFAISFTVEWLNIDDLISIVVETPIFASLPCYSTEKVIPVASQSLYQQFAIQRMTALRTPALIMRRSGDSQYFGFPFLQRLDDPFFGKMQGGNTGDRYLPYSGFIYWGGLAITADTDYDNIVGGISASDSSYDSVINSDSATYAEPA